MKLNDRSVSSTKPALPAGKTDAIFFDDDVPGFGFRVRDSGVKTWVYQYWHGGGTRRITLGRWPKLSAKQARELVDSLAAKVALGHDPQDEKFEARTRKETFGEAVELYLPIKARQLRPRSLVEVERHLNVHAKPLHGIALNSLTLQDVSGLLTAISANNGPIAANRVRASISAMLEWAIGAGKVTTNVASFSNKEVEKSRERVLNDDELAAIWHTLPLGSDYGNIVKLLILTGQRREEIGGLRWSEIKRGLITLPPERTKNGRAHTVPMSKPVHGVLAGVTKTDGRDFVFGLGEGGFSGWGKSKERLDESLPDIPEWNLHDIRRSVASGMADIGVLPHVIEAVLNHVSGHKAGVAGVYNRATYDKERREALELWGKHVMRQTMNHAAMYGLKKQMARRDRAVAQGARQG